jgi:hypothetical protein
MNDKVNQNTLVIYRHYILVVKRQDQDMHRILLQSLCIITVYNVCIVSVEGNK